MDGHSGRSDDSSPRREADVADEREVVPVGPGRGEEPVRALAERLHDPARVLALSDGVFAIIITLLVLEVHVPELTQGQALNQTLAEVHPSLVAFVISFVLAGMYWVGHRDLFALIRRTDRGLVWLNILYLLPLCLLPFAAGLLGRYDTEPVALRIYGLLLVVIAGMRVVMWLYAARSCCGSGWMLASAAPGWSWAWSRGWSTCSPSWSPGAPQP
jgi:uncharacterized membrane protein